MAVEKMRGCGYRKVGGLYLCGGGYSLSCDRLPYELEICPVCGSGVKFSRAWTWLDWLKYAGEHGIDIVEYSDRVINPVGSTCKCPQKDTLNPCPICYPPRYEQPYGLLWVGESNYTPENFVKEALTMGVSKRIPSVPKNLKLGETWILFAHIKACGERIEDRDDGAYKLVGVPGVFYALRPTSLELLVWESDAKPEYIEDLARRNITAIIIPDNDEDHHPDTKTKMTEDDRSAVATSNTIAMLRNSLG